MFTNTCGNGVNLTLDRSLYYIRFVAFRLQRARRTLLQFKTPVLTCCEVLPARRAGRGIGLHIEDTAMVSRIPWSTRGVSKEPYLRRF